VLQRITGVTIMHYINLHFTYLLTYLHARKENVLLPQTVIERLNDLEDEGNADIRFQTFGY